MTISDKIYKKKLHKLICRKLSIGHYIIIRFKYNKENNEVIEWYHNTIDKHSIANSKITEENFLEIKPLLDEYDNLR